MTFPRFKVKGAVINLGMATHIIRAKTPSEAWEKFQRAYSKFKCVHISTGKVA